MKAFEGGFIDRAIHSLKLAIRLGMPHLREAVFDPVLATNAVENVCKGVRILDRVCSENGIEH
jgi:hypothetical protein